MAQEPPAIGRMRRRLVLEAPVAAPDGLGGATQAFETVAALWGRGRMDLRHRSLAPGSA